MAHRGDVSLYPLVKNVLLGIEFEAEANEQSSVEIGLPVLHAQANCRMAKSSRRSVPRLRMRRNGVVGFGEATLTLCGVR